MTHTVFADAVLATTLAGREAQAQAAAVLFPIGGAVLLIGGFVILMINRRRATRGIPPVAAGRRNPSGGRAYSPRPMMITGAGLIVLGIIAIFF